MPLTVLLNLYLFIQLREKKKKSIEENPGMRVEDLFVWVF